jgi:hypothetical protein
MAVDDTGCVPPIPGDFDGDFDVDQDDFGHMQACLSGSGIPQDDPGCLPGRLDWDDDVDQLDLALFLACVTGPDTPGDPACAE